MRKTFFVSVSLIALCQCVISCSSSKHSSKSSDRLPGTWQAKPIVIDGKNDDWTLPYPDYDKKAMIGYAVSNDKDNLYITLETGDPYTQLKILKEGLSVWIDKKGEREMTTSINYPISPDESGDNPQGQRAASQHWQDGQTQGQGQNQRAAMDDKIDKALSRDTVYSLYGFKGCKGDFLLSQTDTCGIVVRVAIDQDNELVWEAVIPFRAFYYKPEIDKRDKGKPLSIGFEITGLKKPAGQGGSQGGGTRSGGPSFGMGMGGMRVGMGGGHGMGGGSHNSSNNANEQLYKSTRTWTDVGIAFQDSH